MAGTRCTGRFPNNCRSHVSRRSPEVQVKPWSPPTGPLGRLSAAAARRAEQLVSQHAEFRAQALAEPRPPSFLEALAAGTTVAVIAELKRRSPSKGVLNDSLGAHERTRAYVAGGARALSILTEPDEFGGSNHDLREARHAVPVPLLKKDFHVHPVQVWEARALGASAMLFIARALDDETLARLVDTAFEAGVEPLVEIRSEDELDAALRTPARVIGVNARNLETLVIDPEVSARLLPAIPAQLLRVAESGMASAADVVRAAAHGADAVLVGSALSAHNDPVAAVQLLAGVARPERDRGAARAG